jgi:nitrate/TMAO reductase-like tetraheme cytochrome c subunit
MLKQNRNPISLIRYPRGVKNRKLVREETPSRRAFFIVLSGLFLIAALLAATPRPSTADPGSASGSPDCASCHSSGQSAVTQETLHGSVHESLVCTSCHVDISSIPHPERLSAVNCGSCHSAEAMGWHKSPHAVKPGAPACVGCHGTHSIHSLRPGNNPAIKLQIAQLCMKCHEKEFESYKTSVHAKALERGSGKAATCTDCHGEHTIQGPESAGSPVAPASVSSTCGSCHGDKKTMATAGLPTDRVSTFKSSFHAAALKMGNMKAATCASCHGAHDILASTDPAARTNPANLPKTCSHCHTGVKQGFAGVKIHVDVSPTGARAAWFVRVFYIGFISILVLGFILHILAERLGSIRNRGSVLHDASSGKGKVQ